MYNKCRLMHAARVNIIIVACVLVRRDCLGALPAAVALPLLKAVPCVIVRCADATAAAQADANSTDKKKLVLAGDTGSTDAAEKQTNAAQGTTWMAPPPPARMQAMMQFFYHTFSTVKK